MQNSGKQCKIFQKAVDNFVEHEPGRQYPDIAVVSDYRRSTDLIAYFFQLNWQIKPTSRCDFRSGEKKKWLPVDAQDAGKTNGNIRILRLCSRFALRFCVLRLRFAFSV